MLEFELPDVGEGVSEGELVAWHVAVGDRVSEGDVLADVETDKAVVELPAPTDGVVRELHAAEGEVVPVGSVVVTIDESGEPTAGSAGESEAATDASDESAASATDPEGAEASAVDAAESGETTNGHGSGRVFAPPRVRRLAREMSVDLAAVQGSGPGGRVTAEDVRAAAGAGGADDETVAAAVTEVADEEPDGEEATGATSSTTKSAITRASSANETTAADAAQGTTGDEEASENASATGSAAADREQTLAVPATRALAEDLGVDIDAVPTDKTREGDPFVTEADVRAFAEREATADAEGEAGTAEPGAGSAATAADAETQPAESAEAGVARREPYRGIRRTIGERMAESHSTVPRATHHDSVVVEELVAVRERLNPHAGDVSLTYMPFVLQAVAAGLQEVPILNTRLDEEREEIVYHDACNVGIATATDDGLLVPVVEDVEEKGLRELAAEVADLTARARSRDIAREEMQGGTFSVTNFGAIGGEYATPIVNYPETAILGLGEITRRPAVEDGEVVARHTLPLSLAIDHRVIDGADGARFVNTVMEYLHEPSLLLLE